MKKIFNKKFFFTVLLVGIMLGGYAVVKTNASYGIFSITGFVNAGSGTTLSGSGTLARPYVISASSTMVSGYTSMQSFVTQTGTATPTATLLVNGFGSTTFTWARTSAGIYTITASSPVFTSGKTVGIYSPLVNLNGAVSITRTNSTTITMTTAVQSLAILGLLGFTATPTDAMLSNNLVELRVYP